MEALINSKESSKAFAEITLEPPRRNIGERSSSAAVSLMLVGIVASLKNMEKEIKGRERSTTI